MMPSAEPKKRILIVDDSFIMRKLIREIVESDELLVVADVAENGQVALQKVREVKPDLVLLDIEMPEMSGLETLRRLGLRSKSKVVILSSLGGEGTAETAEALRLGAAAVLEKPSGSVSLDVVARKGSRILSTIRDVLGLPKLEVESTAVTAVVGIAEAVGSNDDTLFRDVLLGALGSGVLVFDAATRLTTGNAAAARLLGRPALAPGSVTLDELFDEYNEGLGADLRGALASGEKLAPFATDYGLPDGSWQPIRLAAMPWARGNGDKGLLVLLDDMSREQEIKRLLANTMSSDVATKLLEGGKLSLGGTLEQASILFSDIRGFTNLSEELGAAGIVKLLNEYFSYMEDILKSEGGVIDKYIGDAIMALFGVPARLGNDADRAVRGGLGMLAALDVLNRDREGQGQSPIKIGIGIGTGKVVAGTIGSPSRMNYTVIGDPVNLAARIESLTKQYGAELMICDATMQALEQPVASRKLDLVRVKGQNSATMLHEVLRPAQHADPAWLETYAAGFEAYTGGRWSEADGYLRRAVALNPKDKAAMLILERCRTLQAAPPADWDGVWTHHEK
jgi:class 3 adenylate cyclase/ActR/RegA family two-component response regulator